MGRSENGTCESESLTGINHWRYLHIGRGSDPEVPKAKGLAFPSRLDLPTSRSLYIIFTQSLHVLY